MTTGGSVIDNGNNGGGVNYTTAEQDTGLTWVGGETIYQKTLVAGTFPNANSVNVAHGITGLDKIIKFEGYGDDGTNGIPLPYTQQTGDNIQLSSDDTNVVISSTANFSGFSGHITIWYIKT